MKPSIEWMRDRLELLKLMHAEAESLYRADRDSPDLRERLLKIGGKICGYKEALHYMETHDA